MYDPMNRLEVLNAMGLTPRKPSAYNLQSRAVLEYAKTVAVYVADLVDSQTDLYDISEVDLKLEGIHEQGQLLHDRLVQIRRESEVDDREATVPPVDMSWAR